MEEVTGSNPVGPTSLVLTRLAPLVTIHRHDCFNVLHEDEKDRLVDVEWGRSGELYPVAVHYKGSGFYSTDYGRGGKKPAKDGAAAESSSSSSESSSSSSESSSSSDSSSSSSSESSGGGESKPKKSDS